MAGTVKPVKVLTDLVTKKQILKKDSSNNTLFSVSGSQTAGVVTGLVSSSLPISASAVFTPELKISASAPFNFSDLEATRDPTSGHYNVDAAIHAMDVAINKTGITDAVRAQEAVNAYKRVRFQCTGTFDADGYAEVYLPITQSQYDFRTLTNFNAATGLYEPPVYDEAGLPSIDGVAGDANDPNFESFPTTSLDFINVDVMVRDCDDLTNTKLWTNDLVAVYLESTSSNPDDLVNNPYKIVVKIYAPELAGGVEARYRLLATNEDPSLYIIR